MGRSKNIERLAIRLVRGRSLSRMKSKVMNLVGSGRGSIKTRMLPSVGYTSVIYKIILSYYYYILLSLL